MESIHGDFSKYLFQTYLSEANYSKDKMVVLLDKISIILNGIVQHEEEVIELVFKDVNTINGVTEKELKSFIKHRANMVIDNLGIDIPKYTVYDNSIEQWFYTNINALKLHDFFAGSSTSYRRDWSEKKFTRFKGCTND
jgi:ribonucleotide reductase beta subunit family protein with ferritin-like domain